MGIACLLGCGKARFRRGLCCSCYGRACKKIVNGKTTWDKEIAAGRALEAKKVKADHLFRRQNGWT